MPVVAGMMFDRRDYSVIPVRACGLVKRGTSWRVLAALGNYASGWGVCYPSQKTLGELAGNMDQAHVSRAVKDLHQLGLVRLLLPKGRKHPKAVQRGNRYQVLFTPNAPLPSDRELDIGWGARTNRW